MIIYKYEPFNPDEEPEFTSEKLTQILSDLIMKYEISLEEALRLIIEKGLPVNLFLKEGGMEDLVQKFISQINERIQSLLNNYKIEDHYNKLENEIKSKLKELEKFLKKDKKTFEELQKIIANSNLDKLRRLKWSLENQKDLKPILETFSKLLEDKELIYKAMKRYNFQGNLIPNLSETKKIIKELDNLYALIKALEEALEKGDLYNIDLEKIAQYLGVESYQEFLERRESIFKKLTELLQQKGEIIQTESGEFKLSPNSIRRIGINALREIFSQIKSDTTGGSHKSKEFGDSENLSSTTRPYETGDSISQIDFSASILNSIRRGNGAIPSLVDLESFEARGSAKSSTIILLDMSGSMSRYGRFYNAKKMALALNELIHSEYKDDKLSIIGFGTLAKLIKVSELPELNPYPVTIFNPYIKLRFDLSKMNEKDIENRIPLYFTNLQKGLQLARKLLSSKQMKNKDIILITDGAPTAHFEGSVLFINYPPAPSDFDEALREVVLCKEAGITLNTFLLTNEWDFSYFGEKSFIQQFAKASGGRIFYPHPSELNKMVIYDFIENRKKKFYY